MKIYLLMLLCAMLLLNPLGVSAKCMKSYRITSYNIISWRIFDGNRDLDKNDEINSFGWKRSPVNLFQCDRLNAHTLRFTSVHTVSATLYVVSDDVVLESKSLVITKDAPVVLHMENDLTACTLYLTIGDCIYESIS